ncbi:MAG: hypothetical protein ACKPKO_06930, partial [Candidatus Fonsibacter sp.]
MLERRLIERAGWQFEKSWLKSKKGPSKVIKTIYRIRPVGNEFWSTEIIGEQYEGIRSVVF